MQWTVILTTCFFSLILMVLPAFRGMPAYLYFFQPEWLALALSYWVLAAPERVGLITAFSLGFVADLATGSHFGEHGLLYLMLVLFFAATYSQVRVLPIWQQAIIFAFAMLVGLILQYLFLSLTSGSLANAMVFLKAFASALMWPWVFLLLRMIRRRFR